MTGGDDSLGDCGDLLGSLSGTENDLWKALPGPAVVVDSGESDVLERRLAQKLKDVLVGSLRRSGSRLDLLEEGPEFVTRHAAERLSRASKCLTCVDFQFCRAIESSIVQRDGFIFL